METVNQEQTTPNADQADQNVDRTFTQADVDRIVADRLSRERSKYSDYEQIKDKAAKFDQMEESSKSELQKATERADSLQKELDGLKQAAAVREIRMKVSKETGVPETLLTGDTEEACAEQAEAIKAYADPKYPNIKDGGEIQHSVGKKPSTRDQFAEWVTTNIKGE